MTTIDLEELISEDDNPTPHMCRSPVPIEKHGYKEYTQQAAVQSMESSQKAGKQTLENEVTPWNHRLQAAAMTRVPLISTWPSEVQVAIICNSIGSIMDDAISDVMSRAKDLWCNHEVADALAHTTSCTMRKVQ